MILDDFRQGKSITFALPFGRTPMPSTDHFGPYKVIAPISQTGFSVSHAVEVSVRPRVNRLATLTLIRPELSSHAAFASALLQSIEQTELLNHPNITRIFDYGARGETHYCISEFVTGSSLKSLLQHPSMTDEIAVYIVSQLAIAIAHAHTRRDGDGQRVEIIHGDIRPAHVTITPQGAIKIGGYAIGSARAILDVDPVPAADQASDLYAYTEPARARGEALTVNSDLFSLGALLWSLLAGRPLFEGADAQRTEESAKMGDIPDLQSVRPDIHSDLAAIVMSTLGKTPDGGRPVNSAQSLRSGLSAWLRSEGVTVGRPQLKDAFADTFEATNVFGKTRPMTQREFVAQDPHSLLHPPNDDVDDPGVTVDIADLWAMEQPTPSTSAAPAPSAAPTAPPSEPTTVEAPDEQQRRAPHTMAFSPADFDSFDELQPDDDDQTVEYSQLDDDEKAEIELELDADIVSEEISDEYTTESTKAPPAPSEPPHPPQTDSSAVRPGLASVLSASRASQALRGGRDPSAVGKPISSSELPERTSKRTPPSKLPAAPAPPTPVSKPEPRSEPAKKGSISFEDIPTTDEPLFARTATSDPGPSAPSTVEYTQVAPVPDATAPATAAPPAADLTTEPTPQPVAPESAEDTEADVPSERSDTPQAEKKTHSFDPTAIYDEETEVIDYSDSDSDYDDSDIATTRNKRNPVIPILALIVIGLVGYIAYTTFFANEAIVVEERPASLRVESSPGRAHIFIDGEDTGELTPHTFNDLPPDSRVSVHVKLQGYEVADAVGVDLEGGTAKSQRFELTSLKHTINLSSTPEGATIYIDGDEFGTTPAVIGPIEANPTLGVNIHLQLQGYRPRAIQHTWLGDERTSDVNMELEKL